MVVSWLPFTQTRSRSLYTTQSPSGPWGKEASHPKAVWNWSRAWRRKGACFSSVALRRAWAGGVEHWGQAAAPRWAGSPLSQTRPPKCAAAAALWASAAGSCLSSAKCWRMQKSSCLFFLSCRNPGWLLLSGEVLGKEKRAWPLAGTLCLLSLGQGGPNRLAHSFRPAHPIVFLEFCLH